MTAGATTEYPLICTDNSVMILGMPWYSWVRTPIDQLAADGVLFEHCTCQNPVCTPSRASFSPADIPAPPFVAITVNPSPPPRF